jgi:hypothetical protein
MQEVKVGDRVSIDSSKRVFFFQTDGGINLAAEKEETTIIPKTATEEHLKQINLALQRGYLKLGWAEQKVEVPDRISELKEILEQGRNKINDWIYNIRDNKNLESSIKIDRIEKLIDLEKAGKKRTSVLDMAEKILNQIGGVSSVTETDQEKVEIKLAPVDAAKDEPESTK